MAGVGTSKGVSKVVKVQETTADGKPTSTSLTEYTEFKKAIANSPALVSGYQKLLKAAKYYKGPVNGKYTPAFQKALDAAEEARLSISAIRPLTRDEFINEQISFGDGSAKSRTQTYIMNDSDIEALATKIAQSKTGYGLSAKELSQIKKELQLAQKRNPVVQTYDAAGNIVQTGGINEQQFITSKIEQTGAAEKTRAEMANELMLRELGGLQ